MATFKITDPDTGRSLRLTGDSPPSEQELNDIFAGFQAPAQQQIPQQPVQQQPQVSPTISQTQPRPSFSLAPSNPAAFCGFIGERAQQTIAED